jgi:hypothetical protein
LGCPIHRSKSWPPIQTDVPHPLGQIGRGGGQVLMRGSRSHTLDRSTQLFNRGAARAGTDQAPGEVVFVKRPRPDPGRHCLAQRPQSFGIERDAAFASVRA